MFLRQTGKSAQRSPPHTADFGKEFTLTTVLYILLAILAFGFMIAIHELGHFVAARACGVCVHEFSLGMGPRLCGFRGKSGTEYNLRLFPIGGYVSMKGEDEDAEGADSFSQKKAWQKFIIVAAGALMNILVAMILCFALSISDGIRSTVVHSFYDGATSDQWLEVGDRIVEVNGTKTHIASEVAYEVMHDGYVPIDIVVIRDGEHITLENVVFGTMTESGVLYGYRDFVMYRAELTVGNLLKHTWYRSLSTVKMIWESLIDLFIGRVGVEAVSGPVGVTDAMVTAAKSGASNFFNLLAVLAMNLGVFNLLPFPALDGGRLVFILLEMIFRRKVPAKVEGVIHTAGMLLLFALMIFVVFKDVIQLFG